MELVPSVHAVPLISATGYLIDDAGEFTLIDAGLRGSGRRLQRYLARLDRGSEISRIICTHCHPDHIGGVRELTTDATRVFMHPADLGQLKIGLAEAITRWGTGAIIALFTTGPEDAEPVEDGHVFPIRVVGGLEVVHTPGHTPGSICLYSRRHRVLFVGDTLQVDGSGRLTLPHWLFSDDLEQARASVARMAELDVAMIAFSHYPPWTDDPRRALADLAATGATAASRDEPARARYWQA